MRESGFHAQKSGSPTGFMMVVLLHAAVFAALILIKGPAFVRTVYPDTQIFDVPLPREPDPIPPPPETRHPQPQQHQEVIDHPETAVNTNGTTGPAVDTHSNTTVFDTGQPQRIELARVELPPPPVRRDAEIDPAYRGALQPPYPASMVRLNLDGEVRVRVTIGPDGRVTAVQLISATNPAFWAVTEHQALTRWRFRPATVDGRPVESSKVMNLHFQLQDA